jgi:hypothetical protein
MSVSCQQETHAPQQRTSLFNHLVGAGEATDKQSGRDPKKDRLSWRRPALIKQGHGSYGIPIQSPSQSATVIWPAGRERTFFHFGAVMKDHPQSGKVNSYSPLMYILLLLMVGIFVKTGVAIQMYQLN